MTPRPESAGNLEAEVLAARTERDTAVHAAEKKFWLQMGVLSRSYRGAQTDVAAALNVTRDNVYKNVRKYENDEV
ncbi:hypothetical protein ACWGAN_07180 [Streptomyces sp. NPDC054945]